jgi:ketopantoate reductase
MGKRLRAPSASTPYARLRGSTRAVSGLCALTRRPIGDVRHDPDLGSMLDDAMREVVDVGRCCGVQLAPDVIKSVR